MVSGLSYDCIQARIRNIEFLKDLTGKQRGNSSVYHMCRRWISCFSVFLFQTIYMGEGAAQPKLVVLSKHFNYNVVSAMSVCLCQYKNTD